jgi:hypothetical protein
MKYFSILILFFLFLLSCSKDYYNTEEPKYNYFPLEVGKYRIYEVEYTLYNDFTGAVTKTNYYVKDLIESKYTDLSNKDIYRIERYIGTDSTLSNWQIEKVYNLQTSNQFAFTIEENQKFMSLAFPLYLNKTWDGLSFVRKDTTISIPGGNIDVYKSWSLFQVNQFSQNETYGTVLVDSTIWIQRADNNNLIERRYSVEKYGKNVGLVEKTDTILDTQCNGNLINCINLNWMQKAEKGYILHMRLIDSNFL